ncbi:serine hydrolase [Vibrio sp. SCSIO 43135]|uniref:serine hydrolase domain-containing protein n=1 Tax=Vibrio sp. SCSIO 43135 TaxID=2819096 RepID=UPI0020751016|nr:serine hydrolase [Vibrio sp. SCSIO 43135]USD42389.1 serine hydrolase [Vibrio sp. SCSIO 43135]
MKNNTLFCYYHPRIAPFLLIVASWIVSATSFAQHAPASKQVPDLNSIQQYVESIESHDKAMFSLVINDKGRVTYQAQSGFIYEEKHWFSSDEPIAANESSQYQIGSITKMFTATLVFQLIEQGKLSLGTPLSQYFPEFENANDITIEMMLSHRSGLFNYTDSPSFNSYYTQTLSQQELIKHLLKNPGHFPPNTHQEYSNTNYVLLGFIIEQVTGKSYQENLRRNITDKLGLTSTMLCLDYTECGYQTVSYSYLAGQWEALPRWSPTVSVAAGAMISTPSELTVFMRALFNEELISQQSLKDMKGLTSPYGSTKGIWSIPYFHHHAWGHSGLIEGFHSQLIYIDHLDIAIAFNANGLNTKVNEIMKTIIGLYVGKEVEIPNYDRPTIKLTKSELEKFVGQFYSHTWRVDTKLFIDGEQLKAQWTGQPAIALSPLSDFELENRDYGVLLKFDVSPSGKINYRRMVLHQNIWEIDYYKK